MSRSLLVWVPAVLALFLASAATASDVRYVSDDCDISMRRGTDTTFKIMKMLKAGAPLEYLESLEGGWAKIRTDDGNEGFVLSRFLTKSLPARTRVDAAEQAMQKMEEETRVLREELAQLRSRLGSQEKLEAELARVNKVSGRALTLEQLNTELLRNVESLTANLERTKKEKELLEQENDTQFFLSGAGVLLLGVFGGYAFSNRRRGRHGSDLF